MQVLAERTLPESQCGFRTGRSTIDMIFSVRQLQEKCREQRRPLFIAFIDLTKAFDLVSRRGLFNLLEKIGCPPKLLSVISSFHNNMKGTVNYDGATSEPFDIHRGVKQGCVLAPTLFSIFFSMMLSYAFKIHQRRVSSCILEPTVSCLTLPGWEPKQKWDMSSSEKCFSQMMLHWWLIQWKTCSSW